MDELRIALEHFASLRLYETEDERKSDTYSEQLLGTDSVLTLIAAIDASNFDAFGLEGLRIGLHDLYVECFQTRRKGQPNGQSLWVRNNEYPDKPYHELLFKKPMVIHRKAEALQGDAQKLAKRLSTVDDTDELEVPLTPNDHDILSAMRYLKASSLNVVSSAVILKTALGVKESKDAFDRLKANKLVDTKAGRGGGMFLTSKGQKLAKSQG